MGIPAILAAAMKHISWDRVANIALQHGPDFIRKLKEQKQSLSTQEQGGRVTTGELEERIRELASVLIKQEEVIEQHNDRIALLESNCKTLQARVRLVMVIAVVSAVMSLAMAVILLNR